MYRGIGECPSTMRLTVATDVQVLLLRSTKSPWQACNETNTNLLRRLLSPADEPTYAPIKLTSAARQVRAALDQRPTKTLGFQTPASNSRSVCVDRRAGSVTGKVKS